MKPTALVAALVVCWTIAPAPADTHGDWPAVGRDPGAQRFSPLTEITKRNVSSLRQAWTFDTGALDLQVTPIVVNGVMYVSAGSSIFALEPETGKQVWRYDAPGPVSRRGVAYWPGDAANAPRLYSAAGDGRMVAVDARTGAVVSGFGQAGFVDLKRSVRGGTDGRFGLESPPAIYKDVLITGGGNGENEPSTGLYGDIRGWDARSGRLLWSFHTVPRLGEPGVGTWEADSWRDRSGTNAWSFITVDTDRGLVFAPTGSPTADFYGGDRKGRNLYGNTLLALDASTGKLKWFQQLVHHDLWDFDLPAAPVLLDVVLGGRKRPAVAQMTKMSTLFIFDRVTGEPLFGTEERAVPKSEVPGEASWPTQPFPLKPPPLARTTFDPAADFYTLTPEHAAYCKELWDKNHMFAAGLFTPAGTNGTMVMFPGTLGGGNWSGLSHDPGRGLAFANVMNIGQVARMEQRAKPAAGELPYRRTSPWGGPYGRFWDPDTKVPCSAPPFGELVAVDVNRAAIAWRVPLGVLEELKARGFDKTGAPNIGGTIATEAGLIFVGATIDRRFRAFDSDTGALLWETTLDASAHATPMTFLGRDGRQYVVVAAGGDGLLRSPKGTTIVAFALPAK